MSKEQELALIDSLLQDNDKKIRHNTNSLATNHSLIFDYTYSSVSRSYRLYWRKC